MLRPYLDVLAVPGALRFSAAGFLARMPISMVGLGIVFLVEARTGSYAVAGAVSATFGLVQAAAAPLVSRQVDRLGQGRVLPLALSLHVAGLVLLILAAEAGWPRWTLFATAALGAASMVSIGSLVRARWSYVLAGTPHMHVAYSLESVLDEMIFITGPLLVTLLATRVTAPFGLAAAAACALVGGLLLASLRSTSPPPSGATGRVAGSLVRMPAVAMLFATFILVGGIFGSVEVVAVAFTDERGVPVAAGAVLACFAFGSMLSGLLYGAVHWKASLGHRFLVAVLLLAAGVVPFAVVTSVVALGAVMVLAGVAISPMIISGFGLVGVLVPARRLTEGLTWMTTAIGLGMAMSAALAGAVIEGYGAHRAFLLTVGFGALAAIVVIAGRRLLVASAEAPPEGSSAEVPEGSAEESPEGVREPAPGGRVGPAPGPPGVAG